jgi:hypothetical protein
MPFKPGAREISLFVTCPSECEFDLVLFWRSPSRQWFALVPFDNTVYTTNACCMIDLTTPCSALPAIPDHASSGRHRKPNALANQKIEFV